MKWPSSSLEINHSWMPWKPYRKYCHPYEMCPIKSTSTIFRLRYFNAGVLKLFRIFQPDRDRCPPARTASLSNVIRSALLPPSPSSSWRSAPNISRPACAHAPNERHVSLPLSRSIFFNDLPLRAEQLRPRSSCSA